MKTNKNSILAVLLMIWTLFFTQTALIAQVVPKYPDFSKARGSGAKGLDESAKMSPELRILFKQFQGGSKGVGGSQMRFSDGQLRELFGIAAGAGNPLVGVAVTMNSTADLSALKRNGMKVYFRQGKVAYGQVPVGRLGRIAAERAILQIAATRSAQIPERPVSSAPPAILNGLSMDRAKGVRTAGSTPLANEFNKSALTGRGVIVGVIDTGIDWKHPDFMLLNGTSRILAIWDMYDESFATSGGRIGSAGPLLDPQGERLFGTIYTNAQINAALRGSGTVNTMDEYGHGTAVAGTAAGNGRASAGINAGVAPNADLIIVRAAGCGGFANSWIYGAAWITQMAGKLKKPVVINQSFGGHFSSHDGTESEEQFLNQLTGKGIPGVIFTVSAGNEGRSSMHATGRFGPRIAGQEDTFSSPITATITMERTEGSGGKSFLLGLFDSRDDWGIVIVPSAGSSLLDKNGNPLVFYLLKQQGEIRYAMGSGVVKPDNFDAFMSEVISNSRLGPTKDFLVLSLSYGTYDIWGYATSANVANGNFDFYAPRARDVDFGRGTTKSGMVGSPGNASNVITVGAYNFRTKWTNMQNAETVFNLPVGEISDYSSPGGKRSDGVFKPDIASPATYTISPLSAATGPNSESCGGNNMGSGAGARYVTPGGKYIAWEGTSASAPFTAGVIALMLEKNPTLDAEQVRQILIKTAGRSGLIGAVPNPAWGYGMLDPAAAILATSAKKP